jgi:hypothetical protein
MVTGKFGLMVRVMGTSDPQPLDVQANFICKEIEKINPGSWTSYSAANAIQDHTELEFVQNMAFQIIDYSNALAELPNKEGERSKLIPDIEFRFNEALDAWILEVDEEILKALKS